MHRHGRQRSDSPDCSFFQSDQPHTVWALTPTHRNIPVHVGRQQRDDDNDVDSTPSATDTAVVTAAAATATPQPEVTVCLIAPLPGVALVSCGHSVFSRPNFSNGRAIGMVVVRPSVRSSVTDVPWLTGMS